MRCPDTRWGVERAMNRTVPVVLPVSSGLTRGQKREVARARARGQDRGPVRALSQGARRALWAGPACLGSLRPGLCDRLEALPGATQPKAPRSQAPTWLRDLTIGSRTSLGPAFISASFLPAARGGTAASRPSLFAQGL